MDLGRNISPALSSAFQRAIDNAKFEELEHEEYFIEFRKISDNKPYLKDDVNKVDELKNFANTIYWIMDETLIFFSQIKEHMETVEILLNKLEDKVLKLNELFTYKEREIIGREFSKAFTEDNILKIIEDKIKEGNKENDSKRYTHYDLNTIELEHNESIELKTRLDNIKNTDAYEVFIKLKNTITQINTKA